MDEGSVDGQPPLGAAISSGSGVAGDGTLGSDDVAAGGGIVAPESVFKGGTMSVVEPPLPDGGAVEVDEDEVVELSPWNSFNFSLFQTVPSENLTCSTRASNRLVAGLIPSLRHFWLEVAPEFTVPTSFPINIPRVSL